MEVVIVEAVDPFSPGVGGGATTHSVNLLQYLLKSGVSTVFVGTSSSSLQTTHDGLVFIPVTDNTQISTVGYVLRLVTSVSFHKVPPGSIVNVQHPAYALPFVLFCRRSPKVITLHGRILEGVRLKQPRFVTMMYRIVESFCIRRSAAVIAVDEGTREFYEREYPWLTNTVHVIPIGIDLARFKLLDRSAVRERLGFGSEDKLAMFVGRLEVEKDLGFLIESFRLVLKQVPEARLVFVGDGRDRKRLEEISKDLTPRRVLFLGASEPDRMPDIINCADVLALCSLFEGSPTVVKEALACGVPVVTAPVGDVSLIIRSNLVGRIVPKDVSQYSDAIVEFLSKEDRDATRRECVKAASEFGFDQIGAQTVKVYEDLLS